MKSGIPAKPIGVTPKWYFMRKVWEYLFGGQFPIKGVGGVKVQWTNGNYEVSSAVVRQTQSQAGGELQTYRVKSRDEDLLTCRTWDGETEGEDDVLVAVNRNSRYISNLPSETLAGVAHTYSAGTALDSMNPVRVSNNGSDTEDQVVSPLYYVDCEIDAMASNYTGVEYDDTISEELQPVTLIEVSARCWAKIVEPAA